MDDKLIFKLEGGFDDFHYTDYFHTQLYYFYYNRGFIPILLTEITDIISLLFSIIFTYFFFILLDWSSLLQCKNSNNCGDINSYLIYKQLNFFELCIVIISIIYFIYKAYEFVYKIKNLFLVNDYYKNELNIKSNDLYSLSWSTILKKITEKQSIYDIFDITNKIMKKENYMIALIDKKIIDISSCYFTKQLNVNLEYILLNNLNNLNSNTLKLKFILYGIFNFSISIFIFVYQIIYFLISNIDDFYTNKNVLGPRRYNLYATKKFREYNELLHYFEERINKSMKHSNDYTKQFESPIMEVIGKFIGMISGSFLFFFLIISVLDESVLLYVKYLDRTLLFYMGLVTAISSISRSLIKSPEECVYDPNGVMQKIVEHTHYMPKRWEGKCNTYTVRDEFLSLFPYKIILFCYDLISVLTTPYILIFVLSKKSDDIVSFIRLNTIYDDNIGSNICIFAQKKQNFEDDKMKQSLTFFNSNMSSTHRT
jgi:autophagy-related protein 9